MAKKIEEIITYIAIFIFFCSACLLDSEHTFAVLAVMAICGAWIWREELSHVKRKNR